MSYQQNRNIRQAAKDAGVTIAVAKKYIERGTDRLPAIAERVEALDRRVVGHFEAELMETRSDAIKVVQNMSKKLLDSLESVEVVLSSSRLYDENGAERLAPNGKPIVPLDANGVRSVLQAARDITDLLGTLTGGKLDEKAKNQGTTVNVGVVLSPEEVRLAAGKVMKRVVADPKTKESGVIESKFQEVIAGEALKRVETEYDA